MSVCVHGTRILFPEGHGPDARSGKFEFRGRAVLCADIHLHNRGPCVPPKSGLNRYNMIQSGIESIQFRMSQDRRPLIMRIGIRRRRNLPLILQMSAGHARCGREFAGWIGFQTGFTLMNRPVPSAEASSEASPSVSRRHQSAYRGTCCAASSCATTFSQGCHAQNFRSICTGFVQNSRSADRCFAQNSRIPHAAAPPGRARPDSPSGSTAWAWRTAGPAGKARRARSAGDGAGVGAAASGVRRVRRACAMPCCA